MDRDLAARSTAELAARQSYGKLVSILSSRSRDIASAEDALSDALQSALISWPHSGIPEKPEAWLLTAARRNMGHQRRHDLVRSRAQPVLTLLADERSDDALQNNGDHRLQLMFVCTHPAIDPAVQAPLMLQTVLGVDAARIAASFLIEPSAMAQRLVRAKVKIRDAGIAFEVPEQPHTGDRTQAVLSAIYAAFGTGWEDTIVNGRYYGMAEEAIWLGRVLHELLPVDAEVKGLLALMLYCHARAAARIDHNGRFVPFACQDSTLWSRDLIIEAENLLVSASRLMSPGRYQIEAAIQSLHTQSAITGRKNHAAMIGLYAWLARLAPTIGILVAEAAAHCDAEDAERALDLLDAIGHKAAAYQPWWATRAHVLRRLGRNAEACAGFVRAADLSDNSAIRAFLLEQATI